MSTSSAPPFIPPEPVSSVGSHSQHSEKTPWLLNSVYASRTVRAQPNGLSGLNYAWIEDFKALQEK